MHFSLRRLQAQDVEYLSTLHSELFFPMSCALYSFCTASLEVLSAGNPHHLASTSDRQAVILCGAVLGSTLGAYCHAAYGDVRWFPTVADAEELACQGVTGSTGPVHRLAVWRQLTSVFMSPPCHVMLETLMVQLCGDAEQGTFYQLQNPLYQSLLSPTLGIDSMVSDDRDSLVL